MLASLFFSVDEEIMPILINDTATTNQLLQLFPEIKEHYGPDLVAELLVILDTKSGDFLTLSKTNGIEIGKTENVILSLILSCSNATTTKELAV